jgi:hypothetical protein
MKGHTKLCNKQPNGTWTYSCSCARVKKEGLKFEASAAAIHAGHVKFVNRYVQSH